MCVNGNYKFKTAKAFRKQQNMRHETAQIGKQRFIIDVKKYQLFVFFHM